ncbi:MAG TPA: acetate--CoA ligase family protein [Acidimicrobiales bacterium]|nr:acetate--CoA ligase family protein [Acidimicrobiales bacterium]
MPTLSESRSRLLVSEAGIPVSNWETADSTQEAVSLAKNLGFPVVVKLCGDEIAHKTERGLVRLNLNTEEGVEEAADELLSSVTADDGEVTLLVSEQIRGNRELIVGLVRDEQFGPCVMLGVGGILAEAVADVAFRLAPLSRSEASDLIDDLSMQSLLGPFRGEPAVDREALINVLCVLGDLGSDQEILSVDLNPLIVTNGVPIAVDALVETVEG